MQDYRLPPEIFVFELIIEFQQDFKSKIFLDKMITIIFATHNTAKLSRTVCAVLMLLNVNYFKSMSFASTTSQPVSTIPDAQRAVFAILSSPSYSKVVRPGSRTNATLVKVNMFVREINNIDDLKVSYFKFNGHFYTRGIECNF